MTLQKISLSVLSGAAHISELTAEEVAALSLTLAERKQNKLAALASKRWAVETGGIAVSGLTVQTDRETQDRVDQIAKAFEDGDITGVVKFKLGPGQWGELDEATIRAIKAAGAQHIQACFAHESDLDALITAASDQAALDAIDIDSGWPGQ